MCLHAGFCSSACNVDICSQVMISASTMGTSLISPEPMDTGDVMYAPLGVDAPKVMLAVGAQSNANPCQENTVSVTLALNVPVRAGMRVELMNLRGAVCASPLLYIVILIKSNPQSRSDLNTQIHKRARAHTHTHTHRRVRANQHLRAHSSTHAHTHTQDAIDIAQTHGHADLGDTFQDMMRHTQMIYADQTCIPTRALRDVKRDPCTHSGVPTRDTSRTRVRGQGKGT